MQRVMNFNPGPAALPRVVLERAHAEWFDFAGTGMSVLENSHRTKPYEAMQDDAAARIAALYGLGDSHAVLFLQGGASMLFAQVAFNALGGGRRARYLVTGTWGEKAAKEATSVAKLLGEPEPLVHSTKQSEGWAFRDVPERGSIAFDASDAYVHLTTNETVDGVQYALEGSAALPSPSAPLIADMSSDFVSRPMDLARFACVYAGAQKNAGPSGVTIVVVEKAWAEACRKDIPVIFQLRTAIENRSLYNTPPTLGVYLVREVARWIGERGGLVEMAAMAERKCGVVYGAIARSRGFYVCPVEERARSRMNVVFRLPTPELEVAFVKAAEGEGMVGLKGHRVVGGIRASLYNAVEEGWVEALGAFMDAFRAKHGH
jgi:phosphoserine aminotransferase